MAQKNILFITPVLPSLNKRGRNFRAYQWVWRLQKDYQVSVLYTSVYGAKELEGDISLQQLNCRIYTSGHRYSTFQRIKNLMTLKPSAWNEVGERIVEEMHTQEIPTPDRILCFRIQNASTALYVNRALQTPEIWLDIDEVDSRVKYNIANQMMAGGYIWRGIKEWMEATLYSFQEKQRVPKFDTVFASTQDEVRNLNQLNIASETEVYSNMLPAFGKEISVPTEETPFTFMFVGDSNYFPNLDAINFLLFDIIPGLDKVAKTPFKFIIVGGFVGRTQHQQMNKYDCITYYQDIDDLKSIYDQSNAVIVPLRAGGGSSLKFLEALRFKKPVVATSVGVRGFTVDHGFHALIGEGSSEIINHCQRLIDDRKLASDISEYGHQWFLENHAFEVEKAGELEIV